MVVNLIDSESGLLKVWKCEPHRTTPPLDVNVKPQPPLNASDFSRFSLFPRCIFRGFGRSGELYCYQNQRSEISELGRDLVKIVEE